MRSLHLRRDSFSVSKRNTNQKAFYALLRAGLWEQDVRLSQFGEVDYDLVYQQAVEQSVVGLVAAGIEHVVDVKVTQEIALTFVGDTLQMEQHNKEMNVFIAHLIEIMSNVGIFSLLLKGQGIAQCYERPLWRASGDVDILLSDDNYQKAKKLLLPRASYSNIEEKYGKHIGMTIDSWEVELHGTQHCELSIIMDKVIDNVQNDVFEGFNVRKWMNGNTTVYLPASNNDLIFIFTHIIKHYFKEGVGLRQICDWCRLLWTFKNSLNHELLESQIRKMKLMSEWKAFASFAVEYLGMRPEYLPLYSNVKKWKRKADQNCDYIMKVGNFGHNRDMSYFSKYPYIIRKTISLWRRICYLLWQCHIFPYDSFRFIPSFLFNGVRSAMRGE